MKKNITIITVTFNSDQVIERFIKTFKNRYKIIIIENSQNYYLKKKIEKKYKNTKVLVHKNNGFSQSCNYGFKKSNSKYVLFSSPDIKFNEDPVPKFIKFAIKNKNDFGVLIPNEKKTNEKNIKRILEPMGTYAMFVERNQFKKIKGFDENFFLYYEDVDLITNLLKRNKKVFRLPIFFDHKFGSHNKNFNFPIEVNRNWHYMWSKFYYLNKNFDYFTALNKTFPSLISSLIKSCFFFITNRNKFLIYRARFLGLLNSYLKNKSRYRPEI